MEKQNIKALSDKAFIRLIATSVIGILICVACLCSTTYAWFTASVESADSKIEAASDCKLSIRITDGAALDQTVEYGDSLTLDLKKDVNYTVTLSLPRDSASGYCIMSAGDDKYYSPFIQRHDGDPVSVEFTLRVEKDVAVSFDTHWGIYSGYGNVLGGGTLIIGQ